MSGIYPPASHLATHVFDRVTLSGIETWQESTLPYWQVNVPESEREARCPEYLRNLSAKDLSIISTPDSEYRVSTWEEVQTIVKANRLDLFQRVPSELRRYLAYTSNLVKTFGSVGRYVLNQRLQWNAPVQARGASFEFEDDYKVIFNDWPYGIDPQIVHLVIWTKFDLEEDPITGDLSHRGREEIDDFVTRTFRPHVPNDRIIWFKNWRSLKSVGAVEHFHVMMYNPDRAFIRAITNGDIPQCEVFK